MSRYLKLSSTTVLNTEVWENRPANTADIFYVSAVSGVGTRWNWDSANSQFYLPEVLVPAANTVANNTTFPIRIGLDGAEIAVVNGTEDIS
jgi:hypothetical protein